MPTSTLQNGIDLPVMEQLAALPYVNNYHGACFITGEKRFIYMIAGYGQTTFARYDVYSNSWTNLALCPIAPNTSSNASDMTYDFSRKRIYAVFGGATGFYYYDVASNTWSAALATLPIAASSGAQLLHPCSDFGAVSDDFIYYFSGDGSSRKLYRYTISTNTWAELGTDIIPGAPQTFARMLHGRTYEPDKIYIIRGIGTRQFYEYSISGNTMSYTQEIKFSSGTISAGSISDYDHDTNGFYWVEAGLRLINKTKLRLEPYRFPDGTLFNTGAVVSATTNSFTLSNYDLPQDDFVGFAVRITSGAGTGQVRFITGHTSNNLTATPTTTFTIDKPWTVLPGGMNFEIENYTFDYGTATAGASTTITDSTKAWLTNSFQYLRVRIIAGTGAGQERWIASNTATALTVNTAWSVNPDATSVYQIVGWKTYPEATIPYATSNSYYGNTMTTLWIKGIPYVYFSRKNTTAGEFFRFKTITP